VVGTGADFSFMGAVFSPCWICVIDSIGTISTGNDSESCTSKAFGEENETTASATATACKATEDVRPAFMMASAILLLEGHKADILETGGGNAGHDFHDGAVIGSLVTTYENALFIARLGDSLEFRHHFINRNFGFLQEDLAFAVDRNSDRLRIGIHRLGLRIGQVNRHANRQQRRGDHKDDEENE